MNEWLLWLLGFVGFGILSLAVINFYLLNVIKQLENEIDELQPPF